MAALAPETCHERWLSAAPPALAFDPISEFVTWPPTIRAKLVELLGCQPEETAPEVMVEWRDENDLFQETRSFVFTAEPGAEVPCHLLLPKTGRPPYPVVICLQGHSTGMHISLGRPRFPGDEASIAGDRDFAIQAVREGYAALVMEQRCFGERRDSRPGRPESGANCRHASMTSLLLGRTMIGERVWDVSRAVDALLAFPEVDLRLVACMGNSGGGTITYYAACLDERISVAMPSCSVCTYKASIAAIDHCEDNYIPGALRYFEMADLAGLIAPRPLVLVAGRSDAIFPFDGVQDAFATIQGIYSAAGVPDRCRLVVGEGGHRFYAAQAWPTLREIRRVGRLHPSGPLHALSYGRAK